MINLYQDFKIMQDSSENTSNTVLSGVMRLPSKNSYKAYFSTLHESIKLHDKNHVINLTQLDLLNSVGLVALAQCVIYARDYNRSLTIIINSNIPWQKKSIFSLKSLFDKLIIQEHK